MVVHLHRFAPPKPPKGRSQQNQVPLILWSELVAWMWMQPLLEL